MIPVRNIYYMLAYTFQALRENGYKDMAGEKFQNTAELLAAILHRGVTVQVKRGLMRQYITREEPLSVPRGRLEISESIKTQVIRKKQMVCSFDEFSLDAYPNRIIKTAMVLLLRCNISKQRKKELRKLLVFFEAVSTLEPHSINWGISYDRNNQTYRMLMGICQLTIKGLLQSAADGTMRMMDYLDGQTMARLYEKFILCYYRQEHPELKVYSPQIDWQVADGYRERLPIMQTDIVLENPGTGKVLIIDAKYYSHTMQENALYSTQTLHSANLYQIFAYVKNWPAVSDKPVAGMLLYAGTDDDIQPAYEYQMGDNLISVKTLDLNCEFSDIAAQLDRIAESVQLTL